jgi:hypothetical protein
MARLCLLFLLVCTSCWISVQAKDKDVKELQIGVKVNPVKSCISWLFV